MQADDHDGEKELRSLGERIRSSRARHDAAAPGGGRGRPSPLGIAFRIMTELVVAVAAGVLAGWWLDRTFGSWPWMLVIFTPLGMAAGVLNVLRAARALDDEDFGQGAAAEKADGDDAARR